MQAWAFARVSLHLTDEEFFRYTPTQVEALTAIWEQERSWEHALAMATALNAKWSHQDKPLPFTTKDFMPMTPEEQAKWEAAQAKLQKAQQQFLAAGLTSLANSLPKSKPDGTIQGK